MTIDEKRAFTYNLFKINRYIESIADELEDGERFSEELVEIVLKYEIGHLDRSLRKLMQYCNLIMQHPKGGLTYVKRTDI